MIQSISEAEEYFSQFIIKSTQTTGKNITVERMWPLLSQVGNPQNKLSPIHIAGTSGKTSTAYFITALLRESGVSVGLTVSPHVESITERLQINGKPVSEKVFCDLLNRFITVIGDDFDASYFELLIVFVLWSFVELGIEYAVIETGLGGLHDGTNIFSQEYKVCVITDIGFDHQHLLGYTLPEIATQKAGIIQRHNNVFMYEQSQEVMRPIRNRAEEMKATIHIVPSPHISSQLPLFQSRNWALAKAVFDFVATRDKIRGLSLEEIVRSQVDVPGRMQKVMRKNQLFVLDGAHNQQKMTAFVGSFTSDYPNLKVPVILAIKDDKDYPDVIKLLKPITSHMYCSGFTSQQDMLIKSIDPRILAEECKKQKVVASVHETPHDAVQAIYEKNEPVVIATGSFYVLGNILTLLHES